MGEERGRGIRRPPAAAAEEAAAGGLLRGGLQALRVGRLLRQARRLRKAGRREDEGEAMTTAGQLDRPVVTNLNAPSPPSSSFHRFFFLFFFFPIISHFVGCVD